jgi:hypothetical protein
MSRDCPWAGLLPQADRHALPVVARGWLVTTQRAPTPIGPMIGAAAWPRHRAGARRPKTEIMAHATVLNSLQVDSGLSVKFDQILNPIRIALGVALLVVAAYSVWLSYQLYCCTNYQTEGSPAGTLMLVLALTVPVVALISLTFGLIITVRGWRRRARMATDPQVAVQRAPPATREELWWKHARGTRLGALFNGEQAVLMLVHAGGMQASRSDNPGYRGAVGATYPFCSADGRLLQVPTSWTIPSALARRALDHFAEHGDCAPFLAWEAPASLLLITSADDAKSRPWEALLQASS